MYFYLYSLFPIPYSLLLLEISYFIFCWANRLHCCTLPANDIRRKASFFRRQPMNRRKFLQAGTGLAMTAALGAGPRRYAEEFAQRKLRVGLIGSGWYGKCDLLRLIQVAPVEVVSLCDVDKRMLSEAAELVAARQASKQKPRTYDH